MQNILMRHSVVDPAWGLRETGRAILSGSTYFALALIVIGIGLTVGATIFPDFFAGNVSQFGPGTP